MAITIPISSPVPPAATEGFGAGLGGALVGGAVSYFSGRDTARKAKKLAREQMRFQERMSNTAYQRAVKDMRKAGINPMLAYMKGGASSPSGAAPNLRAPELDPQIVSTAKNLASQVTQRKLQNLNLQEQNKLINAQTVQAEAQASSARGVAKQQNVIGDFYLKNPELAPALTLGGGAGAAATGAKSLANIVKGIP